MVWVELRNDRLLQNPLNASDADRDGKTTPPIDQSLVQTGTPAESLPKKSLSLSQGVRPKLSSDLVDDAFADPLLLNSIS